MFSRTILNACFWMILTNSAQDIVQFFRQNTNTEKWTRQELKKGKFKEKIRELGWAFFNIYLVEFAFLLVSGKNPPGKKPSERGRG